MKQASLTMEAAEAASATDGASGPLELEACSAAIEDGLLMVFGPEGDPLPPEVCKEAALARPEASMSVAGGAVPVARILAVLEAQRRQRLAPPGGDAWVRSMLGLGPTPDDASLDELAADGRVELIRFAQELAITTPANQVFLLRAARSDDEEAGLRAADPAGITMSHDALLALVAPDPTDELPAMGVVVEPEGTGVVLILDDAPIRLEPAAPNGPRSIACTAAGDAVDWEVFARALIGAPGLSDRPAARDGLDEGAAPDAQPGEERSASEPPERLVFDDQGFVALGWLEESLARFGDPVTGIVLGGLPSGVRVSAGRAGDHGWRVGPAEVPGLTMFATPEGLEPFILELRVEGVEPPHRWSIEVVPHLEARTEVSPQQPLTVPLDFPPPFSARNRLDYFAVLMIEGVPPGATLSAGVPSAVGRWTLAPEDLRGLRAHIPAGARLPCKLEVIGITIENQEGMLSSARRTLTIGGGDGSADDQTPAVAAVDLRPLLEAAGPDRRVDAIALTGLPPVVELSSGTHDGISNCWVLRSTELSGVTMTVRDPAIRRLCLTARAIVIDATGGATAISRALEVEIPEPAGAGLERVSGGPGFFRSLAERRA